MERTLAGLLFLGLTVAACRRAPDRVVRDTEGRTATLDCTGNGACTVRQAPFALAAPGRLIGLCEGDPGDPRKCRALVCDSDDDCPHVERAEQGSCANGLCIEPAHAFLPADAVLLCLAGTGLGTSSPQQIERYAMALNCGSPCVVPKPCRQP